MHEKIDTEHTFNCDHPGCRKNYGAEGDFGSVWAAARAEGWVNTEFRGQWEHFCSDHAKEVGG